MYLAHSRCVLLLHAEEDVPWPSVCLGLQGEIPLSAAPNGHHASGVTGGLGAWCPRFIVTCSQGFSVPGSLPKCRSTALPPEPDQPR